MTLDFKICNETICKWTLKVSLTMKPNQFLSILTYFTLFIGPEIIFGAPNQVYNLGGEGSQSPQCATIITTDYCMLHVPDSGKHVDVSGERWTLAGAKIEDGCALTVQDCSGSYRTTRASLPPTSFCRTAHSICCECNGCGRSFSQYESDHSCAVLFEHEGCSVCNGFRLLVNPGDEVGRMDGLVDNKVSSMSIAPGCEMRFYLEEGFSGFDYLATGAFDLPDGLNDAISSYKCMCSGYTPMTTTSPEPSSPPSSTLLWTSTTEIVNATTPAPATPGRPQPPRTNATEATTEQTTKVNTLAPNPIN